MLVQCTAGMGHGLCCLLAATAVGCRAAAAAAGCSLGIPSPHQALAVQLAGSSCSAGALLPPASVSQGHNTAPPWMPAPTLLGWLPPLRLAGCPHSDWMPSPTPVAGPGRFPTKSCRCSSPCECASNSDKGMAAWQQRGGLAHSEGRGTQRPGGAGHPFVCTCAFQGRQNVLSGPPNPHPATCLRPTSLPPRPNAPIPHGPPHLSPRCCSGAGSFGKVYKAKWHETLVVRFV